MFHNWTGTASCVVGSRNSYTHQTVHVSRFYVIFKAAKQAMEWFYRGFVDSSIFASFLHIKTAT